MGPGGRTRFRYHFPIRLGRAGKVGVVHRDPLRRKLSGESDPLATATADRGPRRPCIIAVVFGVFLRRRRRLFIGLVGETSDNKSI